MNSQTDAELLTIGHFGRLAQLSRKALRLYDEHGLLVPARIDPETGYRYYTRAQAATARRIRLLRLLLMPLEEIAAVLAAWDGEPAAARQLIQEQVTAVSRQFAAVQVAARLIEAELSPDKEPEMTFTFTYTDKPAQMVVSIRRRITVPAYHQSIQPTLRQLWSHIQAHGARPAGDPIALYYGPVNEEDDGPVEIGVPFTGLVPPAGDIKVRELPAHRVVQVRTFGEYNEYPRLLEMWHAIGKYVQEQNLEPDWGQDMTTYEIWHEDMTMTICWPVHAAPPPA